MQEDREKTSENIKEIAKETKEDVVKGEPIQEHSDIPPIEDKEKEVERRKKRFDFMVMITKWVVLGLIILGLALGGYFIYVKSTKKDMYEKTEESLFETKEKITDSWNTYDSTDLRLGFKYPKDDVINEKTSIEEKIVEVEVIHNINSGTAKTINDLKEGYALKITPLRLYERELDDIANVKRESFYINCPTGVTVSSSLPSVVNNINSKTFEVKNCDGDFTVTYTPRFGMFYEIMQIYKGDIGFKQQYKISTEEVLNTLSFYPEEKEEEQPYKTYADSKYFFRFTYPKELNLDCCSVAEPPVDALEKLVNLGIKKSDSVYAAFTIYMVSDNSANRISFDEFINSQKQKLISDYKIAKGEDPKYIEERLTLGGKLAIRLRGISWKDNDLIYTQTKGNREYFLVFSIENKLGEEFENTLEGILNTYEYFEKER